MNVFGEIFIEWKIDNDLRFMGITTEIFDSLSQLNRIFLVINLIAISCGTRSKVLWEDQLTWY